MISKKKICKSKKHDKKLKKQIFILLDRQGKTLAFYAIIFHHVTKYKNNIINLDDLAMLIHKEGVLFCNLKSMIINIAGLLQYDINESLKIISK